MKKARGYCRYSTTLQHETSIAAQIKAITDYCARNRLELTGIYSDEAKTGTNLDRPGFQQLLADAQAGRIDAVVVYDISRGSRDVVDWFRFRRDMRDIGVEVHSVTEHLGDVSDPASFLTELVTVGMGQTFVLQSRQKSIDAKRVRAERGLFCGGKPPLGYKIVDGRYELVPDEAAAVRLAFEMYARGASYNDICSRLRQLGVRGRKGQIISNNTLYFILGNERYTGKFIWFEREERYMHKHVGRPGAAPIIRTDVIPRIVDEKTWAMVQQRRAENKYNKRNHSKRTYLLSGLIRCGKCGCAYTGFTTRSKGYEYARYGCNAKRVRHDCNAKSIRADLIEGYVLTLLKDVVLNPDVLEGVADIICADAGRSMGTDVSKIKQQILSLEASIDNLWRAVENGLTSQTAYARIAEHEARLDSLRQALSSAEAPYQVDRQILLAQLSRDALRLMNDASALPELIRKYILDVTVSDSEIVIRVLVDQNAKKVATTKESVVTTLGSPGKTRTYNTPVNSRVLCH